MIRFLVIYFFFNFIYYGWCVKVYLICLIPSILCTTRKILFLSSFIENPTKTYQIEPTYNNDVKNYEKIKRILLTGCKFNGFYPLCFENHIMAKPQISEAIFQYIKWFFFFVILIYFRNCFFYKCLSCALIHQNIDITFEKK